MRFLVVRATNISISKRYIDLFKIILENSENEVTLVGRIRRRESIKISRKKVRKQVTSRTHM